MSVEFCDTNVIVYAYDTSAGGKRGRARALLDQLWETGEGALSVQALQELFNALTRKAAQPLSHVDARTIVADMATWRVVMPGAAEVLAAIDGAARWQVSFWGATVLVTASKAGATVVWTEDLNHGQLYDGVLARNRFISPTSLAAG